MIDSVNFEAYVDVVKGTNVISVAAVDGSGNARTNSYEVVVGDAGERVFSYDANGNTTDDGERTYEWDGLDRLVKINYAGEGNYSEFVYDGLGRRVRMREVESGVTISDKRFVWDGLSVVEQRSADGVTVERRYYGQGFEQGGSGGGEAYFYVRDHLGSVRALVDGSGEVRGRWDYSIWGVRGANQVTVDVVGLDFGFTGHFEHGRSGLVLAPYRAYDAELGRWLSRDPIGEDGGINLYGYVGNDPVNLWDPLGLIDWSLVAQGSLTTIGGTLSMVGGAAATAGTGGVGSVFGVPAMFVGATAFGLGMATIVNGFVDNECPIGTPTGTIPQGTAELAGAFTGDPYMQNVGAAADLLSAIVLPPKVGAIPAAANSILNPINLYSDQSPQ